MGEGSEGLGQRHERARCQRKLEENRCDRNHAPCQEARLERNWRKADRGPLVPGSAIDLPRSLL